jgi:GTPase SAR1 family protein
LGTGTNRVRYELGPNGAIVTSLNLFATKFDQVIGILEKRANEHKHIIIDTPGQIEVFTWSASGQIIMETLASSFPTVLARVVCCFVCLFVCLFVCFPLFL